MIRCGYIRITNSKIDDIHTCGHDFCFFDSDGQEAVETELDLDSMVALKRVGMAGLPLAHDLIPVAAQLSAAHMRWWIAVVDSMKKLSIAQDRQDIEQSVYTLLLNLREFDTQKL